MKRSIQLIFILSFALFFFVLQAQGEAATPKMVIEQETFDAGEVYRTGTNLEHSFVIKNAGDVDLNILSATPG